MRLVALSSTRLASALGGVVLAGPGGCDRVPDRASVAAVTSALAASAAPTTRRTSHEVLLCGRVPVMLLLQPRNDII